MLLDRKLLRAECLECVLAKYMKKAPVDADEATKLAYMRDILREAAEAPEWMAAAVLVRNLDRYLLKYFGIKVDMAEERRYYNEWMLERVDLMEQKVRASQDPFRVALSYALFGNYIDFGAMHKVENDQLQALLDEAEKHTFDPINYACLRDDIQKAEKLVYLTDNSGEIVVDRLFIQILKEMYPELEVTVIVKGGPAMNDALREDAEQIGLDRLARILDTGNCVPGTWLPEISEDAMEAMKEADVLISKGQANFENLRHCGLNLYYLFLCKCPMFARNFKVEQFTGMLLREAALDPEI